MNFRDAQPLQALSPNLNRRSINLAIGAGLAAAMLAGLSGWRYARWQQDPERMMDRLDGKEDMPIQETPDMLAKASFESNDDGGHGGDVSVGADRIEEYAGLMSDHGHGDANVNAYVDAQGDAHLNTYH